IVIDVGEVRPHDEQNAVETGLSGYVLEAVWTEISVEARNLALVFQAEDRPGVAIHRGTEAGDEDVEPAVVVVVPEPAGEAIDRLGDAEFFGDVGERAVTVVVIEPIRFLEVGHVEVEQPVAVVVAPRGPLGEAFVEDAGWFGEVAELTCPLVVVEPAAVRLL